MTQREKAEALRRLHTDPELLVLVNVWDAASAATVAAAPGCRAIATASWSIAAAHGLPDGEAIGRAAMLAAVARIAAAVEVPVTADLEAGFGDAAATVAGAIAAGAVGCNLEDGTGAGLRPAGEHVAAVHATRAAGESAGVPVVINARTDAFLERVPDAEAVALERGREYAAAGADCVFMPGVADREVIGRLVAGIDAPVSVLATAAGPSLTELQALGVARASFGPGPMGIALAALARAAGDLLAGGALPPDLAFRPPR